MTHSDTHAEHHPELNGAGAGFVLSLLAFLVQAVVSVWYIWGLVQVS